MRNRVICGEEAQAPCSLCSKTLLHPESCSSGPFADPFTLQNPFPLHLQRDRCFPCQEPPDNLTLSLLSQLHRKSVQVNRVTEECWTWPAAFTEAMTAIWFAQEGLKPRLKKNKPNQTHALTVLPLCCMFASLRSKQKPATCPCLPACFAGAHCMHQIPLPSPSGILPLS